MAGVQWSMTSPQNRPDGSNYLLRYRGLATSSGASAATYPKASGRYASDSAAAGFGFQWLRFALFDEANPANYRRRLPDLVYDDGQLAGAAPHSPIACVASSTPGINTTDLSLNRYTWAQNLEIIAPITPNVVAVDSGVSIDNDPANGAMVLLDNATTSGLGLGTGLPVVAIQFIVQLGGDSALQTFAYDVTIRIRQTSVR